MSVTSCFGAKPCFLSSLRMSRSAACVSRRTLNEHVEDLALVIDGAPQVHPFPSDPNNHLIEVPSRARAWAPLPQLARDQRAEFQHLAPHLFIGDAEPTLGEQFLHVSVAQGEAEIKPDRVLNDLGRKAIRKLDHGSW